MRSFRNPIRMLAPALALGLAVLLGGWGAAAYAADTLRPEIGAPLQQAEELMKAQKYKEALATIGQADAVPNKTPYESLILEQMRGAAAAGAGDTQTAAKAFEAVIASGKLSQDEQLKIMQALAGSFYRAKDYTQAAAWAQRYLKAGGTDPIVPQLLAQSYYLGGDYADAAHELQQRTAAEESAGRAPAEDQLQMLADSELRQKDNAGCLSAMEELVTWYPKKDYWTQVLARVQREPGFSDRLMLDVYRLMQATGTLGSASDYMELAQLALQAGYPAEAKKALDQGYASGVLGTGPEADRQKRLRDLAARQFGEDQKTLGNNTLAAKSADGTALVNNGYNEVLNGQYDQGIALIQQGIAKGQIKHAEDAKLHLGMAYLIAGHKAEALKVLKTVQGSDGVQDLAKLWVAQAHHAAG